MRQHIIKQQWDELSEEEKIKYHETMPDMWALGGPPTIGQLIEFLGEDLYEIANCQNRGENGGWYIYTYLENKQDKTGYFRISKEELCDALWEAVKYKLQKL